MDSCGRGLRQDPPILVEIHTGFHIKDYLVSHALEKRLMVVGNESEVVSETGGV